MKGAEGRGGARIEGSIIASGGVGMVTAVIAAPRAPRAGIAAARGRCLRSVAPPSAGLIPVFPL